MSVMAQAVWLAATMTTVSCALAQTAVRGTTEACESWAILSAGGGPANTLSVCSSLLRELPALREQVARMNALAARDADTRRDLQRFGTTLNEMARKLRPADVKAMADAVAARMQGTNARGDAALLNEIDRLRVGLREMNQKLEQVQSQPAMRPGADAAIGGEAGQAIARLDFDTARGLLDGLQRIENKIDDAQGPYALDPALLALARREAMEGYGQAERAGAPARCAKGWASLRTLLEAAQAMQSQGRLNAAGLTFRELSERSTQIATELGAIDSLAHVNAEAARRQFAFETQMQQQIYDSVVRSFDQRRSGAVSRARTPELRGRIGQADAMRAQALELSAAGRQAEAIDLMVDGANLLGRIESEAGSYPVPLSNLPKPPRRTLQPQATAVDAMSLFPSSLCR
jgi:hypothetical protein